jgi:hypothetical protein
MIAIKNYADFSPLSQNKACTSSRHFLYQYVNFILSKNTFDNTLLTSEFFVLFSGYESLNHIDFLGKEKEQELYKLALEQNEYKFVRTLKHGNFDLKFLGESNGKQHQIRLINSVNVKNEHIKETVKEAIFFTRINCNDMIQNCIRYFIANKHLFIVMNHIDV